MAQDILEMKNKGLMIGDHMPGLSKALYFKRHMVSARQTVVSIFYLFYGPGIEPSL